MTLKGVTTKDLADAQGWSMSTAYNDFGTTYLYKFADEAGNVFIWYASRPIELQERMTLKATIKAHNERNGVKQTVLTRCKVVA